MSPLPPFRCISSSSAENFFQFTGPLSFAVADPGNRPATAPPESSPERALAMDFASAALSDSTEEIVRRWLPIQPRAMAEASTGGRKNVNFTGRWHLGIVPKCQSGTPLHFIA